MSLLECSDIAVNFVITFSTSADTLSTASIVALRISPQFKIENHEKFSEQKKFEIYFHKIIFCVWVKRHFQKVCVLANFRVSKIYWDDDLKESQAT